MKKVFVCSPYAGDIKKNTAKAIEYCQAEIKEGNMPIAPHLLYPRIIPEADKEKRALGIKMGLELLKTCDELHVYGGRISEGMKQEISLWRSMGRLEVYMRQRKPEDQEMRHLTIIVNNFNITPGKDAL